MRMISNSDHSHILLFHVLFCQKTREFFQEFKRESFPHFECLSYVVNKFHRFLDSAENYICTIEYHRKKRSCDSCKENEQDIENITGIHMGES